MTSWTVGVGAAAGRECQVRDLTLPGTARREATRGGPARLGEGTGGHVAPFTHARRRAEGLGTTCVIPAGTAARSPWPVSRSLARFPLPGPCPAETGRADPPTASHIAMPQDLPSQAAARRPSGRITAGGGDLGSSGHAQDTAPPPDSRRPRRPGARARHHPDSGELTGKQPPRSSTAVPRQRNPQMLTLRARNGPPRTHPARRACQTAPGRPRHLHACEASRRGTCLGFRCGEAQLTTTAAPGDRTAAPAPQHPDSGTENDSDRRRRRRLSLRRQPAVAGVRLSGSWPARSSGSRRHRSGRPARAWPGAYAAGRRSG